MTNKFSFSYKLTAVIMTVAVILVSLPLQVFSFDLGGGNASSEPDASTYSADIIEVVENRTAAEKTFRLTDGSFYTAHYDTDIHEEDENGRFTDIDNRLSKNGSLISTSNGRYSFPYKTSDDSSIFTLSGKGISVSFSLQGAAEGIKGEITNTETEFDKDADPLEILTTLDNIRSSVRYENILPGTDIEYGLYGKNVKEDIIVKERDPESDYTYTFTLSLEGLVPDFGENGQIDLVDPETGDTVYFLPAPAMWDAADEFSDAVFYDISSGENGTYILTVTADAGWINDESRAFPVTIDPPVYSISYSVLDTDISSSYPSTSYSTSTTLYVSTGRRSYWKLTTLPTLPQSAYVTNAVISMHAYTASAQVDGYVAAYDVLTDWNSSLTWNLANSSSNPAGQLADTFTDYAHVYTENDDDYYYYPNGDTFSWNITPIVKKWYEGNNYGVSFAAPSGVSFTGIAKFLSNDYSVYSVRPSLCITYSDMKGLEDYWSFASQDAGFAGQAYINNATGNLVVSIPTLTTTDAIMPVSPALVYNHCMYFGDYKYPTAQTANYTSFTSKSFKLNLNETLIQKEYTNGSGNNANYVIWADGDGTEHYFFPKSGSSTVYEDEDGLHLTLTIGSSNCTIKDSSDTVKTFSSRPSPADNPEEIVSAWYLSSITDKSGNKVIIGADSLNDYRPTSVSLKPVGVSSSIEQLRFVYTTGGKLCAVYNPTSGEGVVFRYSSTFSGTVGTSYGNYLRYVIRAHGATSENGWLAFYNTNGTSSTASVTVDAVASYDYNYLGIITKITNLQTGLRLEYNVFYSKKVSICKEYSTILSSYGQKLDYTYTTAGTVLRTSGKDDILNNSDDLLTTITFDNYGRPVSSYTTDVNRTKLYGSSGVDFVDDNARARNSIKTTVNTPEHSSGYLLNGGFEKGSFQYWSSTGSAAVSQSLPKNSLNAAELKVSAGIASSSVYQYVDLDKGDYTLSLDYLTADIPAGVSVWLKAESTDNSTHSVIKQLPVNACFASGDYSFDSLNFTADPSVSGGKEHFKISVLITGVVTSDVTVWVDNVMLSRTIGAIGYDLTSSGHFETSNGITPAAFWKLLGEETVPISTADSGIDVFGDVLHIDVPFYDISLPYQTVYSATPAMKAEYAAGQANYDAEPVLFKLSGWGKGTGQSYALGSNFCIDAEVRYYNGTTYRSCDYYLEFDPGIVDWQFGSIGFATDPSKGMIDSIKIYVLYTGNPGEGFFDSISLVRSDSGTSVYEYGSSGYISSGHNGSSTIVYEYDSGNENKVTKVINTSNRTITDYTYDSSKRLLSEANSKYTGYFYPRTGTFSSGSTVSQLSVTTYSYNNYGLVTEVETEDVSVTPHLKTKMTSAYATGISSHIFGVKESETDSLGNTTRYFYDSSNGRLKAVTNPDGKGTCYSYDGMGNLTEVLPAVVSGQTYSSVSGSADVSYGYDQTTKRLSTVTTHPNATQTTVYSFSYDGFGNTTGISAGNHTLASYTYNSNNGKLNTLVYGNGLNVRYVYDELERISEIQYWNGSSGSFDTVYSYTYDSAGRLRSVTDHDSFDITVYDYDNAGRLISSYVYNSSSGYNKSGSAVYYNDDTSKVSMVFNSFDYSCPGGTDYDDTYCSYFYSDITGNISRLQTAGDSIAGNIYPEYDNLGRSKSRTLDYNIDGNDAFYNKLTYFYCSNAGYTSGRISQVTSEIRKGANTYVLSASTYKYTYDANGNITEIKDANNVIQYRYTYDSLGQLIREDNRPLDRSVEYEYDRAGNIQYIYTYNGFTTGSLSGDFDDSAEFNYGDSTWKDLVTEADGSYITYDAIGNPVTIGQTSLTWRGRQLTNYSLSSTKNVSYYYNADGIRTSKTFVDGSTTTRHEYTLNGSQIVKETVFTGNTESYTLVYLYDEYGSPIGFRYRTPSYSANVFDGYFFEKNIQGDVIGIWNQNGTKVVNYTYDAWGNVTVSGTCATGIGAKNPFRYRGYYYDTETSLYYLQTRYYNPHWGRFINADTFINAGNELLGYNMFAYCGNNPVMGYDPTGEWDWSKFASGLTMVAAAAVCVLSVAASVASCGTLTPVMAVVAAVTVTAAVAYATEGVAEMVEAGTDYNFVRDGMMGGDEEAYQASKVILSTTMQIGTMIVGAGACFIAGTQVAAESGNVPIETVLAGDYVWSWSEETGDVSLKQVVRTFVKESDELVHLTVNGEEITCTKEHPFYSPKKGWTAACQLRAGDILVTVNGEYVVLEKVQHEILENPVKVYNFEVEEFHTYFVGISNVLVHNTCSAKEIGTYLIKNSSDEVIYVGKGSVARMNWSMRFRHGATSVFYPAATKEIALANEAYFMSIYGGAKSVNSASKLLNMINSPGLRFLFEWF